MEIERQHYLEQLIKTIDNGFVKIITGLRRVGKTYLLFNQFYNYLINSGVNESSIIKLSLDEYENRKYHDLDELYKYLNNKIENCKEPKKYIFIDEIQLAKPKYNKETKEEITFHYVLISLMKKADIYVTGSNSKMLSKEIITEFRGRGQQIMVYPISFKEFVEFNPYSKSIKELWVDFYTYGSLPRTLLFSNNEHKINYLKEIFMVVYIRDIVERYIIKKDQDILDILAKLLASNISCLFNPLNIQNKFDSELKIKVSSITIKNYLNYFIDSFIINEIKRFDIKGNKYISSPSKFYFSDCGIRNAIINFNNLKKPQLLENIVFNELMYRGYNVACGNIEKYDKKDGKTIRKTLEIDFIATKNADKFYIQVVDKIDSKEKTDQEIRSLREIKNEFKKIVIIDDDFKMYLDENGILFCSINDFLLTKNWE